MKRLIMTAAFLSALGFAAAAQAASTATLASPAPKDTSLIAGDVFWACNGASCVTQSDDSGMSLFVACRDLKNQLNIAVTDLTSGSRKLTADELARCNK